MFNIVFYIYYHIISYCMQVVLFETEKDRAKMFPLTYCKSIVDLQMGIFQVKERWRHVMREQYPIAVYTDFYLQGLYPNIHVGEDSLFIHACLLPSEEVVKAILELEVGQAYTNKEGQLIVGRRELNNLQHAIKVKEFQEINHHPSSWRYIEYPWDLLQYNAHYIEQDIQWLQKAKKSCPIPASNIVIGSSNKIFIEEGAQVIYSYLNTTEGPIYIGKNANIMEGAFLRGPLAVGEGTIIKIGTQLYSSNSIGKFCICGGEIKNNIISSFTNKGHDGYIGDSIVGEWCNIAAGTQISNLKNDVSDVRVWNEYSQEFHIVGKKFGMLMGDYSRTAINTPVNTGTFIGVGCNVFGAHLTPKYIKNFNWGYEKNKKYDLEQIMIDIANWKQLKNIPFSIEQKKVIEFIYEKWK